MTTDTTPAEPEAKPESAESFLVHVKNVLKNSGLMQAITHEDHGTVVCAGYQLLARTVFDGAGEQHWARLEYSMLDAKRSDTATQQQRMKIRYAMVAAYTALLEAAGYRVMAGVTGITNRPYLNITRKAAQ